MSKLLLAAPLALFSAGSTADGPLFFHPASDATLTRTASFALTLELEDYDLSQMGEPIEPGDLDESLDPSEMGGEASFELTYTDAYARTERGRALDFVRTYVEFAVDGEVTDDEDDDQVRVARFVWNADGGGYDVTAPEIEDLTDAQRNQLETMRADVDHTHLLPSSDVAVGDSWEVALGASGLVAAVMPIFEWEGALDMILAEAEDDVDTDPEQIAMITDLMADLADELDGATAALTYKGRRADDEGGNVAVMDIELETSLTMDLGDRFTEMVEAEMDGDDAEGATPTIELVVELSLEGEGELLWNTDGNHLHTLDLPLDMEIAIEGRFAIDLPGLGELEFVAGDATWSGALEILQTAARD